MTIVSSVCRTLSTVRCAESGSSTGKQLGKVAICFLSVEHFTVNLFYEVIASHQKCGRAPLIPPLTPGERMLINRQ